MRSCLLGFILVAGAATSAYAQSADPPLPPNYARAPEIHDGMAPGMKATELSPKVRIFRLVFSKGDDVTAGLAEFATALHKEFGVQLISTGGTAKFLRDAGLPVTDVADVTQIAYYPDGDANVARRGRVRQLTDAAGLVRRPMITTSSARRERRWIRTA